MLDRYRPKRLTTPEDAVRTARIAAEHQQATARFYAAERRRRLFALLLLVVACGGVGYFIFRQWLAAPLSSLSSAPTGPGAAQPNLVNQTAVREAVYRALQSRGVGSGRGDRAILSDGHERRDLDLRPPEERRERSPK